MSGRFKDNANGTITDTLTGLIWLGDAHGFEKQNWETALVSARTLKSGMNGLMDGSSPGDWRLPSLREMRTLIDYSQRDPALPEGHPFINLRDDTYYWTTTPWAVNSQIKAWYVGTDGCVAAGDKRLSHCTLWPVRG